MASLTKKLVFLWKQRSHWHFSKRKTEDIFTQIYRDNTWGGVAGEYFSGSGSTNPNTDLYVNKIIDFVRENHVNHIVDLGCGDFRVMNRVVSAVDAQYTGIDIVKDLIENHNEKFNTPRINFLHLNIIDDDLPDGDLVLIRQVFQHLSNDEISKILSKISKYKWALITEHVPVSGSIEFNIDKLSGPHIRMKANSGVFIDQPPFNIRNVRVLLEYREDDLVKGKMVPAAIRTYLVTNHS